MRIIDADALTAGIEKEMCRPCEARGDDHHGIKCRACGTGDALEFVEDAPTVDITEEQAIDKLHETGWMQRHDKEMTKRPTAEWIEGTQGFYCSRCDYYDSDYFEHKFCPECGARIRTISQYHVKEAENDR